MTARAGPELALGTVQFGLAYGVAGSGAKPTDAEARAVLERAAAHGVRRLDTAPAYGDIEERLAGLIEGLDFEVVSKVPAVPQGLDAAGRSRFVQHSLAQSRERLGEAMCGVLFHRAEDLAGSDGEALWQVATRWGEANRVAAGVSCYDPPTLTGLAAKWPIAMAQLPASALDQRLAALPQALDSIELTVRSLFLQGLLLMPSAEARQRVPAAAASLARWERWCRDRELSPLSAALAFGKGMAGVSYCVVGVENAAQMDEIAEAWASAEPITDATLASDELAVIDPREWKVAA